MILSIAGFLSVVAPFLLNLVEKAPTDYFILLIKLLMVGAPLGFLFFSGFQLVKGMNVGA